MEYAGIDNLCISVLHVSVVRLNVMMIKFYFKLLKW